MYDQAISPTRARAKKRKLKLPPNVVPHRDKFRGKVRVDGRLFQSRTYATSQEAADWVDRFRKNEKLATAGGPVTLAQAWKLVCEDMAANGVRDGTRRFAEDKYRALTRAWPDTTEMHRIGAPQVRAYMTHRRERDGVGSTTIRAEAVLLKRLFKTARAARGALIDNPFDLETGGVRLPKATSRRYDHLPSSEIETIVGRIRAAAEKHPRWAWDADLFEFVFLTGLRSAEVARLHVDDVETFKGQLAVVGKNDYRTVYLADRAKALLVRLIAAAGKDGFLIPSPKGTERHRALVASAVVTRWKRRLGIKLHGSMHVLRHSFATDAANRRVPILDLKEAGGWKTLAMVARYYHGSPSRLRAVADSVANKSAFRDPDAGAPAGTAPGGQQPDSTQAM